jgi:hypothetical protein
MSLVISMHRLEVPAMNEQQRVDGGSCGAPHAVSVDDWQNLEAQLMALVLDAREEGEAQ